MCLPLASTSSPPAVKNTETPPSIVPSDAISQAAYAYASQQLHPVVLDHSIRVYLYAKSLSERESSPWHEEDRLALLFTACLLHDIGTTAAHDGPQRFEVEGGDAAAAFLTSRGASRSDAHEVWVAIALHTSPGIAERISPLARILRMAVLADFKRPVAMELYDTALVENIETAFPRLEIEKILGDAVVEQALRRRAKAPPGSWVDLIVRSKLENPDWEGVNKAFGPG